MTTTSQKPFARADHVGSLLRPATVSKARRDFAAGALSASALRAIEDAAIAEAVRHQEASGLTIVTDGEFRRENWWIDFIRQIDGAVIAQPDTANSFSPGGAKTWVPLTVETRGKIKWTRPLLVNDFKALAAVSSATPKVTLPAPSRVHFQGGDASIDRAIYPDLEEFWADLADFYAHEIAALEAAGCRYIQIDDPVMSYFVDEAARGRMQARGMDPDLTLRRYVDVINRSVAQRKNETLVAVHICRGNARSTWAASGGYERIADIVFPHLKVDSLLLEFDDDRSGDFAPLACLRPQTRIVLGLITSKRPELEDSGQIKKRIDEAARLVPLDRLALSPQCGFASTEEGNLVSADAQWKKLALVCDIARDVWGNQ